jgi:hypothetical protein
MDAARPKQMSTFDHPVSPHKQQYMQEMLSKHTLTTYGSYTITEPAGLFALNVHRSTTLWNICLSISYMISSY